MASPPFVTSGSCCVPGCEVTLKFDEEDSSHLYVCRHSLVNLGDYFKAMFFGEFKEKYQNEIEIHGVLRSDMLLFLRFSVQAQMFPVCPTSPANITELYTLISLADRFLYPKLCDDIVSHLPEWAPNWSPTAAELCQLISLGDRLLTCDLNQAIAKDILCSMKMFEETSEFKLAIVEAAYEHREGSKVILEACIRLCVNVELVDVAQLQGKGMDGVVFAIYATIGKATPQMSDAPQHESNVQGADCYYGAQFNVLRFTVTNNVKHWQWYCSNCRQDQEATMPFENSKRSCKLRLKTVSFCR